MEFLNWIIAHPVEAIVIYIAAHTLIVDALKAWRGK